MLRISTIKKALTRIYWVPTALFVVAVPLFLITASVTWAFNNSGVYQKGFEKYDISFVTGITEADLTQVAADIRGYFNSRAEPLQLRTRVFGQEQDLFKPKEIVHMRDVKKLVRGVYVIAGVSALYLLLAAGAGFLRRGRNYLEVLSRRLLWGGVLTLASIIGVGLFALVGFDTLFLKFHQLSFANDFWQLDSRTDFLVMLFPQDFWFDATMWVTLRAVTGALIISVLAGGYLLYLRMGATRTSGNSIAPLEEAQEA